MQIIFASLSALFGLFLWLYLLSYMLASGSRTDFILLMRKGVLRGAVVAIIFVLLTILPLWSEVIYYDWFLLPAVFCLISLPFSWKILSWRIMLPWLIALFFGGLVVFFNLENTIIWPPVHEEIGKTYQWLTSVYPGILSPFVSLGFGTLENFRYFSVEWSIVQVIWRTFFSLPLHIFVGIFACWIILSFRSKTLWVILAIMLASILHILYNWSLLHGFIGAIAIIIAGYLFYGWSLENGWWKKRLWVTR